MASSLELNKLFAGVLTAGIIAVGAGVFAGILYRPQPLEQHALSVALPEGDAGDNGAAVDDTPPLAVLLASADPGAGETLTRQCTACHVFTEGGDNRVGPALWGVLGRDIAAVPGFNYSAALTGLDGAWDYDKLDHFLANPRGFAPGTSMSYAGLRNAGDRANLIAFLRSLSSDPLPLPEAEAEAAAAEEPVEGAAETTADAAEETTETVADATEEATETVADTAEEVTETVADAAEEATETVADAAEEAAETVADAAEEAAETVTEATEEAATTVADAASDVVEEAAEAATEVAQAAAGAAASPMVAMVSTADPADGERAFRQCAACHTVDKGGQNRVGPNLWDVFGADVGHHEGFNYSPALLAVEGSWTVDKLDAYLANPREFAPGNRMAFAGVRAPEQRAGLIAFLRTLSDDPKPAEIQ